MTKTLTEQWREHKLKYKQNYYLLLEDGGEDIQPFMGGFFMSESNEVKEVLAPVPSYDEYKQLVSNSDELVQKIHILNEQNTKQYNELCEEIKKNNILEKRLARTKTKEYIVKVDWFSPDPVGFLSEKQTRKMFDDWKKKKEVK